MRGLGVGSEVQDLGVGSGHGVWTWGWGVGSQCGVWAQGLGCGVWEWGVGSGHRVWAPRGVGAGSGVQGLACQGRQPSSGAFCRFQPPHQSGRPAPTGDQETQIVK